MKKFITGAIIAASAIIVAIFCIDTSIFWAALAVSGIGLYIMYKGNCELDKKRHYLTYEEAKKLGMFD